MKNSIIFFLLFIGNCCYDQFHYNFDDTKSALKSELFIKGWIPSFLPESCKNIDLTYDIDTNHVWIKCKYSNFSVDKPKIKLKRIENLNQSIPVPCNSQWFIDDEVRNINKSNNNFEIYTIITEKSTNWILLKNIINNELYFVGF